MLTRWFLSIGLEIYAVFCVFYQSYIGVRTDEAKYLLDIPYPHPPLARFIISLLDGWAYQEIFWRIVLATLLIQSVWMIIDLLKKSTVLVRAAGAMCWLFSASVLLQSGSIMMVTVTALQALLLVWLYLRERPVQPYLLALLWVACLFTAYQSLLFGPIVFFLYRKQKTGFIRTCIFCAVPILLLVLYTFTNPLALASFMNQAGQDAAQSLLQHLIGTVRLWAIGGSIVLSTAGTFGLFFRPKAGLIWTFLLVAAYVLLARYDYYALLFTPILIAGVVLLLRSVPTAATSFLTLMPIGLVLSLMIASYNSVDIVPRITHMIDTSTGTGDTLIVGSFGHEWQFYSSRPLKPFSLSLLREAHAVVCLAVCEEMQHLPTGQVGQTGWHRLEGVQTEVWVRNH